MEFERIIILDDNDITVFVNEEVVKMAYPNVEISTYISSQVFLNDALNNPAQFERPTLLLLDLNMPEKFGYEVMEELEEEIDDLDELYVLILTSSNLIRDLERSSRFPNVIGYIEKPLSEENLKQSLGGDY